MKFGEILCWGVGDEIGRVVGGLVYRDISASIDIDISDVVGSDYGEEVELEFGVEVDYEDVRGVNRIVKDVTQSKYNRATG